MATNRMYGATSLIGGAAGALDSIDGTDLIDKDMAIANDQTTTYFYALDDDSGALEASPTVIKPDANAGDKRWILQSMRAHEFISTAGNNPLNVGIDDTEEGAINIYGGAAWTNGAILDMYSGPFTGAAFVDITSDTFMHWSNNALGTASDVSNNDTNDTEVRNFTYLAIDIEVPKTATRFRIWQDSAPHFNQMENFGKLQGSNNSTDGTDGDWDTLVIFSGNLLAPGGYPGWTQTLSFANTTAYRWYRIADTFGDNNTTTNEWEILAETSGTDYYRIQRYQNDLMIGTKDDTDAMVFVGDSLYCTLAINMKTAINDLTTITGTSDVTVLDVVTGDVNIADQLTVPTLVIGDMTYTDSLITNTNPPAPLQLATSVDITGYLSFDGSGAQVLAWSGSDPTGITGTAGANGNLAAWDGNGDLVDAGAGGAGYVLHSLADAVGDFLVASGDNTFVKKTLAETGAILEADLDHGNLQGLSTGADHSYIDQDVTITSTPTFASITLADAGKHTWDALPLTDNTCSGDITSETVHVNGVGVGAILCLTDANGWDEADADAEATCGLLGMAVETGTGTKLVMHQGWYHMASHGFTIGAQLFVHTTQGLMTNTAPSGTGDVVQVVGYATTAHVIRFNPSPDYAVVT